MKKTIFFIFVVLLLVLNISYITNADVFNNETMIVYWTSDENRTWSNATSLLMDGAVSGNPIYREDHTMVGSGNTNFDAGDGDMVKFDNAKLNTAINFTIGCWFTSQDTDTFEIIFGRYNGDYTAGDFRVYDDDRTASNNNNWRFQMFDGDMDYIQSGFYDDDTTQQGNKQLIIFRVNQTLPNIDMTLFINETIILSASTTESSYAITSDPFTIGMVESSETESWDDYLDECFFFNYSIYPDEIHYLWTNGSVGNTLNYTEAVEAPPADSCDCPTSGDWIKTDDCPIDEDCDMQGNDVYLYIDTDIYATIYNFGSLYTYDAMALCWNKQCFE